MGDGTHTHARLFCHQQRSKQIARPTALSQQDEDLPGDPRRHDSRRPMSRRNLLENAKGTALGIGLAEPMRGTALRRASTGRAVGAVAAGSWGLGLGREGVRPAEAFGGPSRPLSR